MVNNNLQAVGSSNIPDISILIPVYNVEKYLIRCLDSVFNQQFSGIYEVIAVNDASTDSSLQLLKAYQAKESRLKIIEHETNKSLSIARSTAMKAATGNYIMHVDSDDWLLPNSLKDLYKKCKETGADVIVFNYYREDSKGKKIYVKGIEEELSTTDKRAVQNYFFGACWNKIVKKSLTENMIYSEAAIRSEEDLLYATEILLRARSIYLLPENYYVWFYNVASITSLGKPDLFLQQQGTILKKIEAMINTYTPDSRIIKALLKYFENWIHVALLKIHFGKKENAFECYALVTNLFSSPVMSKHNINNLRLSISSKVSCFIKVSKNLSLKTAIGIAYRSYRNRNL